MNFRAEQQNRKLRLDIYDVIGADFLGNGITSRMVSDTIAKAGEIDQIEVHINSPGGDAFDGIAIYNQLKQFPGVVNVFVDGVAASAASVIAMAGDQRVVNTGGTIMIHNASGFTFGNKETHMKQAGTLGKLDKSIANIYAEATGGDAATILELMAEETWLDADDALADGFATQVAPSEAVASPSLRFINLYNNVPLKVAAWAGQASGDHTEPTAETQAMDEPTKEEDEKTMEDRLAELEARIAAMEEGDEDEEKPEEEEDEPQASATPEAQAIAQAFAHDNAFALSMIAAGKTLNEAYVAYADHAKTQIAAAQQRVAAMSDGADAVVTSPQAAIQPADGADKKREEVQKRAAKMTNAYARNSYLASLGYDPANFDFDND